jgi:hypothetical protein
MSGSAVYPSIVLAGSANPPTSADLTASADLKASADLTASADSPVTALVPSPLGLLSAAFPATRFLSPSQSSTGSGIAAETARLAPSAAFGGPAFPPTVLVRSPGVADSALGKTPLFNESSTAGRTESLDPQTEAAAGGGSPSAISPALIGIIAAVVALLAIFAVVIGVILYRRREQTPPQAEEEPTVTFTDTRIDNELECENPLAGSDDFTIESAAFESEPNETPGML